MKKLKSNKLKKNYFAWAIFSIINNTKNKRKQIIAWRLIGDKKVLIEVSFRVIRKLRKEIVLVAVNPQDKTELMNMVTATGKINLYLPNDLVLFQSQVKGKELDGSVRIEIPSYIAQIDRREDARFHLIDTINVPLKFTKNINRHLAKTQFFEKSCFDLSAGGLSFITSKSESKFFQVGDEIKDILFKLGTKDIKLDAKITSISNLEPNEQNKLHYSGSKICLEYTHIDKKIKDTIEKFIFQNINIQEDVI